MTRLWIALPLTILAACGSEEATSVSIKGDGGNTIASVKDGKVEIRTPAFQGSIKLPKFAFGADAFEVDGLKLYPGSTIANLDVASDGGTDGNVKVQFNAPGAAEQVQGWFREQMRLAGFTVQLKDGALSGTTRDGSPFSLKIDPAGEGKARGTLSVNGT